MYCPKCATQNNDDTKFCRSCGTNLSLVPQALTGRLPEAPSGRRSRREGRHDFDHGGPANIANAITKIFMGIGFLFVAGASFLFAPAGRIWWFWMLIPAFAMLGKGVAELVSLKYGSSIGPGTAQTTMPPAQPAREIPPPNETSYPPPSVTEQTTRQLDRNTDPYRYRDRDQ